MNSLKLFCAEGSTKIRKSKSPDLMLSRGEKMTPWEAQKQQSCQAGIPIKRAVCYK